MIWIDGKFRFELSLGSTQVRLLKRQNSKIGMSVSSLRIVLQRTIQDALRALKATLAWDSGCSAAALDRVAPD